MKTLLIDACTSDKSRTRALANSVNRGNQYYAQGSLMTSEEETLEHLGFMTC